MTAPDKKKALILGVLLAVAGGVWAWTSRSGAPAASNTTSVKPSGSTPTKKNLEPIDPTIHLERLDVQVAENSGKVNIFQYRQKPLPPPPPQVVQRPTPIIYTPPPPTTPVVVVQPFKAFKYEGYSILGSPKTGRIMGSLTEGGNTYQVTEGECLMGQYCVRRLTEALIEIEDLQLKRRQSFSRIQQ